MNDNKTNIAILGSTGSIGQQTLDIMRNFPGAFRVVALAGGSNTALLADQVNEFKPKFIYANTEFTKPGNTKVLPMEEMACHPDIDLIVLATSGKAGLNPILSAIKAGKKIALANKEVLVMAGEIIMAQANKYNAKIFPVDSEHSAIWQCLNGEKAEVSRLILTASGGPFYKYTRIQMDTITVEDALNHPTWKMGRKVTIDSATLMNKGLEAIEAHWLFDIPFEKIEIIIHPQSIIHSMVEFPDGSVKAQLSSPDMRLPIQYALSYPDRIQNTSLPRMNFPGTKPLTFEKINYELFPCLELALKAGKRGNTYPAVLCAADEIGVELFLNKRIAFPSISEIISRTIDLHDAVSSPTIEDILSADKWARETAAKIAVKRSLCY
jgi:1-deoxy-D-xylulose-5-phosphate reductoisomerase